MNQGKPMTDETPNLDPMLADIINAFLKWPLPESVAADACVMRPGKKRTGTNVFTCSETLAMVKEVIEPILKIELANRNLKEAEDYAVICALETERAQLRARVEALEQDKASLTQLLRNKLVEVQEQQQGGITT